MKVLGFLATQTRCVVAMEACASAHYWGRVVGELGHEERLVPPIYVKPYVKRFKNDAAEAEVICEAATRATIRFVAVKTEEKQARGMLFRTRGLLLDNADLSEAWFKRANLSNTWLDGSNLSKTNLKKANLADAQLLGANLSNANLKNANLSAAFFDGADMLNAQLEKAKAPNTHFHQVSLSGAKLSGVKLTNTNLTGATGLIQA